MSDRTPVFGDKIMVIAHDRWTHAVALWPLAAGRFVAAPWTSGTHNYGGVDDPEWRWPEVGEWPDTETDTLGDTATG